jgi:hypothetical protein
VFKARGAETLSALRGPEEELRAPSRVRAEVVQPESSDPEEARRVRSGGPEALALRALEAPAAGLPARFGDETATEWPASMDRTAIAGLRIFPLEL